MTDNRTALAERLEQTIRDLGEHRQTHVVWRDWLLKDPANASVNPHAGSAEFHDNTIKDYDRHLSAIREAAQALRADAGAEAVAAVLRGTKRAHVVWNEGEEETVADGAKLYTRPQPATPQRVPDGMALVEKSIIPLPAIEKGVRTLALARQMGYDDGTLVSMVYCEMLLVADLSSAMLAALPGDGSAQGGEGCGDHDHANYIPGCGRCAGTLPAKTTRHVPDRINAVAEKINRLAWQQHTMGGVGWLGAELLKLEKELRSLATPARQHAGGGS